MAKTIKQLEEELISSNHKQKQLYKALVQANEVNALLGQVKSIKTMTNELENRIFHVMSENRKKPGDLVAMMDSLTVFGGCAHPLMDYIEMPEPEPEPKEDDEPVTMVPKGGK